MERITFRPIIVNAKPIKKRNLVWENAVVISKYLNVKTPYIMKLFKIFGEKKVLDSMSYVKDSTGDPYAVLMWKLKSTT